MNRPVELSVQEYYRGVVTASFTLTLPDREEALVEAGRRAEAAFLNRDAQAVRVHLSYEGSPRTFKTLSLKPRR